MAGIFPGLTRGTRRRYASLRSRVSAAPSHTGEPMQKTELDMPLDLPEHASEIALWAAVLRLMLEDAQRYWQGRTPALDYEREQAFDDVVACGPMLRRCCGFLDLDAQWISEAFVKQCDVMA